MQHCGNGPGVVALIGRSGGAQRKNLVHNKMGRASDIKHREERGPLNVMSRLVPCKINTVPGSHLEADNINRTETCSCSCRCADLEHGAARLGSLEAMRGRLIRMETA